MSTTERASRAGRARAASLSPDRRKEIASQAHLASAVAAVVNRAPDLSADQVAKLRAVFAPAVAAR
ncbi:hypothetical protein [Micromonospora inositola]|nr:hypothetical protein [Micromonospora inositola]